MDRPVVNCRCCRYPMSVILQSTGQPGQVDMWLVTCEHRDCPMNGFTLSADDYADLDLTKYLGPRGRG